MEPIQETVIHTSTDTFLFRNNFNITSNYTWNTDEQHEAIDLLLAYQTEVFCVVLTLAVLGTVLNSGVMALLLHPGYFLSMRSCLQLCLAGSGLLLATTSCPMYAAAVFNRAWPFYDIGCIWYAMSFRFIGGIANYTLAAMAIER